MVQKLDGRLAYFGKWDDPQAALKEYIRYAAEHLDTIPAPEVQQSVPSLGVGELADLYLDRQQTRRDHHELTHNTLRNVRRRIMAFIQLVGRERMIGDLTPQLFEKHRTHLVTRLRPKTAHMEMGWVLAMLRYAAKVGLISAIPATAYAYDRPSAPTIRRDHLAFVAEHGKPFFQAGEVRKGSVTESAG